MKVNELMTPAPQCVTPDTSIEETARRMKEHDIGVVPVCLDDRLVGMVTDRDLALRAVAESCDPGKTMVRDVMSPHVIFCFEDDDVEAAAARMEERQIRRLPVLDRNKRLIGIISIGDIATRAGDDRLSGEILERVSEPAPSEA